MPPDPPDLPELERLAEQVLRSPGSGPLSYALAKETQALVARCREVEKEREVWPLHVEVYVEGQGHRLYTAGDG